MPHFCVAGVLANRSIVRCSFSQALHRSPTSANCDAGRASDGSSSRAFPTPSPASVSTIPEIALFRTRPTSRSRGTAIRHGRVPNAPRLVSARVCRTSYNLRVQRSRNQQYCGGPLPLSRPRSALPEFPENVQATSHFARVPVCTDIRTPLPILQIASRKSNLVKHGLEKTRPDFLPAVFQCCKTVAVGQPSVAALAWLPSNVANTYMCELQMSTLGTMVSWRWYACV